MDKREKEFIEKYDMKPIVEVMDSALKKLTDKTINKEKGQTLFYRIRSFVRSNKAAIEIMNIIHPLLEKERERCAEIAETWIITTQEEQNLSKIGVDDRKLIAKAIKGKK